MRLAICGLDPEVRAPDPRRAGQVGQVGFGRYYKASPNCFTLSNTNTTHYSR